MNETQTLELPGDISPDVLTSPFILTLCRLRSGDVVRELADDFVQVVNASQITGKKAEISLKLTTKPNGAGKILVSDSPSKKLPRPEQGNTALFSTPQGQLLPFDPAQLELNLKTVQFEPQRVKDAQDLTPKIKAKQG